MCPQGYLFYSDWADKAACIGRSRLDGSEHTIIIDVEKNKNRWDLFLSMSSIYLSQAFPKVY